MNKRHIIEEIRRTADLNDGKPLGRTKFFSETGIQESDWRGRYWTKWSDALKEAGYPPNPFQSAYDDSFLIENLISLIREIGHFPVEAELRLKARQDAGFPSHNTFRRLGRKADRASKIIAYCEDCKGYEDIVRICQPLTEVETKSDSEASSDDEDVGYVYLMRMGKTKYYKLGYSKSVGRREYELTRQTPEKMKLVHKFETDDPVGIEDYWKKRFADSKTHGEFFALSPKEIKAFKRWRLIR